MVGIHDYHRQVMSFSQVPINSTFIVGECVYKKLDNSTAEFELANGNVVTITFQPNNIVELATLYKDRNYVQ